MKKSWYLFKKNWPITVTITTFIVLITLWAINPYDILSWLFGKENTKSNSDILSYIGIICGSIIIIGTLSANIKRNLITEKGQLDIRFKDAALLLSKNDTASALSGIYALHQVAIETSQAKFSEKGYIRVIHNILCSYLKENSRIGTIANGIIQNGMNNKPTIVIQTIVDVLFKNEIYSEIESDLSKCVFINIDFSNTLLKNIKFMNSFFHNNTIKGIYIEDCNFYKSSMIDNMIGFCRFVSVSFDETFIKNNKSTKNIITDCYFNSAQIYDNTFRGSRISDTFFIGSSISHCDFGFSHLTNCNFRESIIKDLSFQSASLRTCTFHNASLYDIDFSKAIFKNNSVIFRGTILEDSLYDEILLLSKELTNKKS